MGAKTSVWRRWNLTSNHQSFRQTKHLSLTKSFPNAFINTKHSPIDSSLKAFFHFLFLSLCNSVEFPGVIFVQLWPRMWVGLPLRVLGWQHLTKSWPWPSAALMVRMLHFLLSFFPLSFSPFSLGSRIKIDGLVDLID